MRRVLIVTPHFPPDSSAAAHRVRLLAPYLPDFEWEATVVTMQPGAYEARLDPQLAALVPDSLRVVRVPAWSAGWTRRVGVGDLGLRAFDNLRRACMRLLSAERFDALIVTTYPIYPALLGPMLKRQFRVPFVLDFQDPWVGSWGATVGGGKDGGPDLKSRISRQLAAVLEPIVVRSADAITAVSTATYEDVLARVPLAQRPVCATLPLGWEPADFAAVNDTPNGYFNPADGALHLSYVGTLLPNGFGTLRALLGAVRRLREEDRDLYARLRLHFFGTSNQFADGAPRRVEPIARELGVADVVTEIAPRIPYVDALRVLAQSSAILMLGSSERHYTASKIFPALLARRPIVALYHKASSASSILEAAGGPPSIRLVTYSEADAGCAPRVDEVHQVLRDLIRHPVYDPTAVDLSSASGVSARGVAADLAGVLDRVHESR